MTAPRVLGVDLSIRATGLCHPDGRRGLVTTEKRADGDPDVRRRLRTIRGTVAVAAEHADLVVLEDIARGAQGSAVHHLAGLAYVVRSALDTLRIPFAIVGAQQLKKYATGKGTAAKGDMRMALYQRTGIDEPDDNLVDAWWLRHMGLDHLGDPIVAIPQAQRAVLAKITWPGRAAA